MVRAWILVVSLYKTIDSCLAGCHNILTKRIQNALVRIDYYLINLQPTFNS